MFSLFLLSLLSKYKNTSRKKSFDPICRLGALLLNLRIDVTHDTCELLQNTQFYITKASTWYPDSLIRARGHCPGTIICCDRHLSSITE